MQKNSNTIEPNLTASLVNSFNPWALTVNRLCKTSDERLLEATEALSKQSLRNMPVHMVSSDLAESFKTRIRNNQKELQSKTGFDIVPLGPVSLRYVEEDESAQEQNFVSKKFDNAHGLFSIDPPEKVQIDGASKTSSVQVSGGISVAGGKTTTNNVKSVTVHGHTLMLTLQRRMNANRWAFTLDNANALIRWFDVAFRTVDWSPSTSGDKITLPKGGKAQRNRVSFVEFKKGHLLVLLSQKTNGHTIYLGASEAKRFQEALMRSISPASRV